MRRKETNQEMLQQENTKPKLNCNQKCKTKVNVAIPKTEDPLFKTRGQQHQQKYQSNVKNIADFISLA